MLSPIDTSSLLGGLPGAGGGAGGLPGLSTAATGGSGPAAFFDAGLTESLLLQTQTAAAAQPIFSEKQAEALAEKIQVTAEALEEGRFEAARDGAREILRDDYNNPIGYHLLGRIASERGDLDTAAQFFDRAAQLSPGNERFADDAFVNRQLKRGGQQVLETAEELVQRPDTAMRGVRLLFEMGRRSDRQGETFLLIAKGFETLNLPVQQLGAFDAVLVEGAPAELQVLEGELKQFIDNHEPVGLAYSLLGRTQQRLGKSDEAVYSLEQARDIAPEVSQYTSELANVYAASGNESLARGDLASAKHRFNLAHEMDLANEDISLGLAAVHVSIANRSLDQRLDNNARLNLLRAGTLLGEDESLDGELARAYQRLAQREESRELYSLALADLESAYDRQPDLPGLRRSLAESHRAAAQRILDDNPEGDLSTSEHEDIVGHHQAAFDLYRARSSYRQDLAESLNDFGLKLMNENENYERAVEIFKQARDLEPDNTTYLANWQQAWNLNNQ